MKVVYIDGRGQSYLDSQRLLHLQFTLFHVTIHYCQHFFRSSVQIIKDKIGSQECCLYTSVFYRIKLRGTPGHVKSIWVLKLPLSITNVLICLDVALTIVKDKHPLVKGSIYIHQKNKIYCEKKLIFPK